MDFIYTVLTQHHDSGRFIVPVPISASSPAEAASKRFAEQVPSSQGGTTALLVYNLSEAYVYPVRRPIAGDVSPVPLQVTPLAQETHMALQDIATHIKKLLRKKTPHTASDFAEIIFGNADGRLVSRAIGSLLADGEIAVAGSRPTTYVKP